MATINFNVGTNTAVLGSELNSLATATDSSAGTEYNNTPSGSSAGFTNAVAELVIDFTTSATAGTAAYLYEITAPDGTNYADANSTSARLVAVFPLRNISTAQRPAPRIIDLPPCKIKYLLRTDASATTESSGNTVKILPFNFASN